MIELVGKYTKAIVYNDNIKYIKKGSSKQHNIRIVFN